MVEALGIEVGGTPHSPSPTSQDFVASYDSNANGIIEISELFDAIDDYFDGEIPISDLFTVIDYYFSEDLVPKFAGDWSEVVKTHI